MTDSNNPNTTGDNGMDIITETASKPDTDGLNAAIRENASRGENATECDNAPQGDESIAVTLPAALSESKNKTEYNRERVKTGLHEWLGSFVAALLFVVVLFTFVMRVVRVEGRSMYPTLNDKDYLVITDNFGKPETGDIVVLQVPSYKSGTPLIKRVIATEGQHVIINFDTWEVTVDGVTLDETYTNKVGYVMNRLDCPEDFVVSEGCVFVMGDNRNDSTDSRSRMIGQVDERFIMGKVIFRLFSYSPLGTDTNPLLSPFN